MSGVIGGQTCVHVILVIRKVVLSKFNTHRKCNIHRECIKN